MFNEHKNIRILQGIAQGTPTSHLANELDMDPKHLLERQRKIQERAIENLPREQRTKLKKHQQFVGKLAPAVHRDLDNYIL